MNKPTAIIQNIILIWNLLKYLRIKNCLMYFLYVNKKIIKVINVENKGINSRSDIW